VVEKKSRVRSEENSDGQSEGPEQTNSSGVVGDKELVLEDGKTPRERAGRYKLATAKLPISVLTFQWADSENRKIDRKHVERLCAVFEEEGGPARKAYENYLLVQCTKEEVDRMAKHLPAKDGSIDDDTSILFEDFSHWSAVNSQKVEVIAGQHRVEALKKYLASKKGPAEDLWWICEIYNRSKLNPMFIYDANWCRYP
jgi:hypothetical protein